MVNIMAADSSYFAIFAFRGVDLYPEYDYLRFDPGVDGAFPAAGFLEEYPEL